MKLNKNMDAEQLASSLYKEAVEKEQASAIFNDLMDVRQVFRDNPDLVEFFENRAIEKANKEQVMHDLIESFFELTKEFIHTIYEFKQMDELSFIINEFEKIYDYHNRTVVAKVTTAVPLSEDQRKRLMDAFAQKMKAKKVIFNETVEPEILGGVIIEADDQTFDGSVRFNLEQMKKHVL